MKRKPEKAERFADLAEYYTTVADDLPPGEIVAGIKDFAARLGRASPFAGLTSHALGIAAFGRLKAKWIAQRLDAKGL